MSIATKLESSKFNKLQPLFRQPLQQSTAEMARVIPGLTPTPIPRRADPLTDLTLLLSRLQRTILHADAEREARLRESDFEREKAHAVGIQYLA
jgi:hypothetical protein